MGRYDFREIHQTEVRASPEAVFRAIGAVTAAEIPFVRLLFLIRALPGRLSGGQSLTVSEGPLLEGMLASGFILIDEVVNREIVLGAAGRFWQPRGAAFLRFADVDAFHTFDRAGFARAAISFVVRPTRRPGVQLLSTETRIVIPDLSSRRRFGLYWRVIRPGSGLIRRMLLRAVRRRAETR